LKIFNCLRIRQKGQSSLIDLVIGFFIFTLVFVSVFTAMNKNEKDFMRNNTLDEIRHSSFFAIKELAETGGFPSEWEELNENSVERIGLMKNNEINEDKLVAFSNMSYDRSRELLNLEGFDYFFVLDGTDYVTAGLAPGSQAEYLITTKRIVSYKGSEAEIELQVYVLWE